jgi:hypothetical protein
MPEALQGHSSRPSQAAGWLPGPPPWLEDVELAADVRLAAELPCEECARVGGGYLARHRLRGRSYEAFSVCSCGHHNEI